MAAGEEKGEDPIERAMRRKAEAEQSAKEAAAAKRGSVMDRAFEQDAEEVPRYEPEEPSFFAPSAGERAEQARRAAQRVRRRVKGEDMEPRVEAPARPVPKPQSRPQSRAPQPGAESRPVAAPTPMAQHGAKAEPTISRPKPSQPQAGAPSLMDRAMGRPAANTQPAPAEAKPQPAQRPVLRAVNRPPAEAQPAPPKIPVLTKAERRIAEGRAAAKAATPAEPAPAAPQPATVAKTTAAASSLMDRASGAAKPKPAETAKTPPPPRPEQPRIKRPSLKARVEQAIPAAPPPVVQKTAPVAAVTAAATTAPAAAYAEPAADSSVYADDRVVTPTSSLRVVKTKAFAPFEWMIASRYLRSRKKEGFVSVITGFSLVGIALGVATLIVVMAVMTGFRETLITQIIGGSPHINVTSQVGPFENYDEVADQIRTVDGVEYVTPVVQGQVLGSANQRHSAIAVRGMRKADLERLIETAEPEVINGTLDNFFEDDGIALGADLAAKMGLRVGDFVTLISPDGDITPFQATPMPRVKDYKIIHTFKLGVQEIDYFVAFMPFAEAQIYFNKQKQADTLDVFVEDAQNVEKYSDPIFEASRSSIGLYNWKNQNGRLIGAINLERQVMFVILTMIILVASLNIISGLVMLVKDKARDVAIMRTMGMARGSILRIFFICGSSIGVIGSIAGVILGVLFVVNIHAIQGGVEWLTGTSVWDPAMRAGISKIPTKLQFSDVALTLFIALGLSFIATLFPAWKAAKLDPVEALRYE